jgi:hypothetical protein
MAVLVTSVIGPPWLGSHGDYSPTATATPSLKLLVPSGSLIRCQSVQVYYHHPAFGRVGRNYLVWPVLMLWVQSSLSFRRGPTPPQCPDIHFPQSDGSPVCIAISSFTVCLKVLLTILLLPRCNRSLGPGPLCRCCIPVAPDVCSRMSVLSRFLLQHLSLPGPSRPCPLRGAGMARRGIGLRTVPNFFRDPPSPCPFLRLSEAP